VKLDLSFLEEIKGESLGLFIVMSTEALIFNESILGDKVLFYSPEFSPHFGQ
jgi:hypothetical protein